MKGKIPSIGKYGRKAYKVSVYRTERDKTILKPLVFVIADNKTSALSKLKRSRYYNSKSEYVIK